MNLRLLTIDIYNSIACYLDESSSQYYKSDIKELIEEQCEKHWNIYQEEESLDAKFNDTYRDD